MPDSPAARQSFPLSSLFILVAACALVCGLWTPVARAVAADEVGLVEATVAALGGTLLGAALGCGIGAGHHQPWRGAGWGTLSGGVVGLFAGPLALAPPRTFSSLVAMSVGGGVALLLTAAAVSLSKRGGEDAS